MLNILSSYCVEGTTQVSRVALVGSIFGYFPFESGGVEAFHHCFSLFFCQPCCQGAVCLPLPTAMCGQEESQLGFRAETDDKK